MQNTTMKKRAIDLLLASKKYGQVYIDFEIELDEENTLPVRITAPDILELQNQRLVRYEELLAEFTEKGLAKRPVNEQEWEKSIEKLTPERRVEVEKEKPQNRAEQLAYMQTWQSVIIDQLPSCLLDPSTGERLFPTPSEQEQFSRIVRSNVELFKLLTEKYIELSNLMSMVDETVKN